MDIKNPPPVLGIPDGVAESEQLELLDMGVLLGFAHIDIAEQSVDRVPAVHGSHSGALVELLAGVGDEGPDGYGALGAGG